MTDGFKALADTTRRRIVEMVARTEMAAGDIAREFEMSAPAVSQHLKILREAGLIKVRVDGQRRLYSPEVAGLSELEAWFARVRGFWNPRLDRLAQEIKRAQRKKRGGKS